MRDTWFASSGGCSWDGVFVVGDLTKSNSLSPEQRDEFARRIDEEVKQYNDLLVLDVEESWRESLTYKSAALVQLAHRSGAKWLFKTDDDSYLNVPQLLDTLNEMDFKKPTYGGEIWWRSKVIREKAHKFYVSEEQWPEPYYPPYASGAGYFISKAAVTKMLPEIATSTFIPMEDACIGVMMHNIGILTPVDLALQPKHCVQRSHSTRRNFVSVRPPLRRLATSASTFCATI